MVRPNWFVAFPFEGSFVADLPAPPPRFRRFHPDDVHVTLAFLGAVGDAGANRAWDALLEQLSEAPRSAIDVSLGAVVPMGARGEYTALSALLEQGRRETEACIVELRDALTEAANGRRERRAAKAHLTVARPQRRAAASDRAAGLDWARELDLSGVTSRLDRIALYTWHDARDERLFRIVREIALPSQSPP